MRACLPAPPAPPDITISRDFSNDPALTVSGLSVYVGNVPGTSKAGEEVLPMNRGLIGTIIGILVIIILVIVILQLT